MIARADAMSGARAAPTARPAGTEIRYVTRSGSAAMSMSTIAPKTISQTAVPTNADGVFAAVAVSATGGVKTFFLTAPPCTGARLEAVAFAAAFAFAAARARAAALAFAADAAFAFLAACAAVERVGFAAVDDPTVERRLDDAVPEGVEGAGCGEDDECVEDVDCDGV